MTFIIHEWMLKEHKGIQLLIYAYIYGVTQDGKSTFQGGIPALKKISGSTTPTIKKSLNKLVEDGWLSEIEFDRGDNIYMTIKKEERKAPRLYINKGGVEFRSIDDTYVPKNQTYFNLAYDFWKMWRDNEKSPSKTILKAKAQDWEDDIRMIVEIDNIPIIRLVAILTYFRIALSGEAGYDTFWANTIQSISAFRKHTDGVYILDRITKIVQKKIDDDRIFKNKVLNNDKY